MSISRDNPNPGIGYSTRATRKQPVNRMYRANHYSGGGYTYYPVVIIGAGESGIAVAYKLKHRLKCDQFRVYDRQSGVGGTWWINRYPGIACDIPAAFYSFSFFQNPKWTTFYPPGPEIYDYLQDCCDKFGLTDKIELNTEVLGAKWLEDVEEWEVELQHLVAGTGDMSIKDRENRVKDLGQFSVFTHKEKVRCKVLVSGVGVLVEPKGTPDVPGADSFKGDMFHSARWDYSVKMTNKDVVVVGTGCSAIQFLPHLTKAPFNAKSVTQIMRSPPWVVPKIVPPGGNETWATYSSFMNKYVPGFQNTFRLFAAAGAEAGWTLFGTGKKSQKARARIEKKLMKWMSDTAPRQYHDMLTPDYSIGCKRRVFDSTWYESLKDPKIELTTMPLTAIQETSVTLGPGTVYPKSTASKDAPPAKNIPADVIVLANGFEANHWLHPLKVKGKGGADLIDTMNKRGGAQAYLGTAMDGFPNFLIMVGPNTATGHSSVILASENQSDYAMKLIRPVLAGDVATFDVKKSAEMAYTKDIQTKLKDTVFMTGGCTSWYYEPNGWNSTVLPYSQIWFWYRTRFIRWRDWNLTRTTKGLIKLIFWRLFRLVGMAAVAYVIYLRRTAEVPLEDLLDNYRTVALAAALMGVTKLRKKIMKAM